MFAQSEEVALARRPLGMPLYGAALATGRPCRDLMPGQSIAVSGRRQRLRICVDDAGLEFLPDGAGAIPVKPNDSFAIAGAPAVIWGTLTLTIPPAFLLPF